MPINFGSLGGTSTVDTATEPRRIFAALPERADKYTFPRDVQSEVWDGWHTRRNERDLIIRMNTGGGKTVVGLLILKSCLNEGVGPAVYLTPDRYLADQVRAEAAQLGIEVTDDPRDSRFRRGKAILVVNLRKLVNGRSTFGTAETGQSIEIGSLLVDDAHAGVTDLQQQFTLNVERSHALYDRLLALFETELRLRSANAFRDIQEHEWNAVLEIPYWLWADRQEQVLEILRPHRGDEQVKFAWPLIKNCLGICRVSVTAQNIEISPPCPPIDQIPSLVNARRRVYLTATLADDSVLVTHFGADASTVARPITPATAADLGDRMILAPLDTMPLTTGQEVVEFVVQHARAINVVVIVPSKRAAQNWSQHAAMILDKDTIHDGVRQLREGHVGLVVLINKYDGIDLPGRACHLLVLDGLPEVYGGLDRLDGLALGESEAMSTRQVQRIEQGMGRGVRSANDYCVVLLLGAKLTHRLYTSGGPERFSPATRAQLRLSARVTDELHGKSFAEFASVVDQCLDRDIGWVNLSRSTLDGVQYDGIRPLAVVAQAQRRAFDEAAIGQYRGAADTLQTAVDNLETSQYRLRGWLLQQTAAYRHHDDPVQAQKTLAAALRINKNVLKPRDDVAYKRLSAHASQAKAAANFLAAKYDTPEHLMTGFNSILDDLVPHPETTEAFEQAWADLGTHLGFSTERPERERGNGPDDLWALGESRFLVTECKSGTTAATGIARKDVEQLSHSVDWFIENYDNTCTPIPLIIHKRSNLNSDASPRVGARVITFARLNDLSKAVRVLARAIARPSAFSDPDIIAVQLQSNKLTARLLVQTWSVDLRSN